MYMDRKLFKNTVLYIIELVGEGGMLNKGVSPLYP
jgi:hypothetical protein